MLLYIRINNMVLEIIKKIAALGMLYTGCRPCPYNGYRCSTSSTLTQSIHT